MHPLKFAMQMSTCLYLTSVFVLKRAKLSAYQTRRAVKGRCESAVASELCGGRFYDVWTVDAPAFLRTRLGAVLLLS